jgi:hypothetical protein
VTGADLSDTTYVRIRVRSSNLFLSEHYYGKIVQGRYLPFDTGWLMGDPNFCFDSSIRCFPEYFYCFLSFSTASTFAITGVQKQSEAALLHVRVDGVVMQHDCQ